MIEAVASRLAQCPGLDAEALQRLQGSRVAIVGAGVLGGTVIYHLGLLGVPMVIIDCDRVEPENLGNAGFDVASVGMWKSVARARQVRAMNPECAVQPVNARIEDLGMATFGDCDLIVGGLDSRRARVRLNEISRLGLPYIDAAIDGSGQALFGTVSVFDPRREDSACLLCPHDSDSLAALIEEERGSGCPSWRKAEVPTTAPTLQTSSLAGIVASFQALWAVRLLLGLGDDLVNKHLVINADGHPRMELLDLERNACCLGDHSSLGPLRPASGETVGELWAGARSELATEPDALLLHHRSLVAGLECYRCGASRDLIRLSEALREDDICCDCSSEAEMVPIEIGRELRATQMDRLGRLSWRELGFPARDVVTVTAGEHTIHYVVNAPGADGMSEEYA